MKLSASIEDPQSTDPKIVLLSLNREFDRLNHEHFDGALVRPEILFSTRKTYGGYFRPSSNRIVLSWQAYQEHGWDETINTFRHEVAHIVHRNHSKAFWDLAKQLGVTRKYAANPIKKSGNAKRYVYVCPNCAQRVVRARRLRPTSCGLCDKKFNPQFLLKLVKDSS